MAISLTIRRWWQWALSVLALALSAGVGWLVAKFFMPLGCPLCICKNGPALLAIDPQYFTGWWWITGAIIAALIFAALPLYGMWFEQRKRSNWRVYG